MAAPARPTEQQRALAQLAGNWKGTQKLSPSPWDANAKGEASTTITAKLGLADLFVLVDYTQSLPDKTTYLAHLVIGFNASKAEHQIFWFDTNGSIGPPFTGTLDGKTLTVQRTGGKASMQVTWTIAAAKMTLVLSHSTDGKTWTPFSEGTFQKA